MKKSDVLKQERAEKYERMQAIQTGAETAKRDLNEEETTEFDTLEREMEEIDTKIERAEKFEKRQLEQAGASTPTPKPDEFEREQKNYSVGKAIQEEAQRILNGGQGLTGREREVQDEMVKRFNSYSQGILIPQSRADEATLTTHAGVKDTAAIQDLSIVGKDPIYKQMGLKIYSGLTKELPLSYKAPLVATKKSEQAAAANHGIVPSKVTLSPNRFSDTQEWTLELLSVENPMILAAEFQELVTGCDRALTKEVYDMLVAEGITGTTGGALTRAGLLKLVEAVDAPMGIFLMERATAFEAMSVALNANSERYLLDIADNNKARSFAGADAYHSSLFADGGAAQYVFYGDPKKIAVGEFGAIQLIINPFSGDTTGEVRVTAHKIADVKLRDPNAWAVTPNLGS